MKDILNKFAAPLPAVTLLILALLAAAPVWGPGMVNTHAGGDSPFLLWRTQQLAVNLRAGVFPVRWMPDAAYGYGYPFFSYMAVLPLYVAAVLNILGLDILTAIKLTQTLGCIASAFAMYGWARRHLSQTGAWLAAVAYTFSAYHLVNVYTRGDSLHEFYAFVFYPLILWGLDLTFERHDARSVAALALAYAGLSITHNLSVVIFTPFALLYAAIQAIYFVSFILALNTRRSAFHVRLFHLRLVLSYLAPCAVALILGLVLSAWVWLPAIGETGYGQFGEQTTGYLNYSNHFRDASLIQPTLAFDYDVAQTTPFAMSSAQAALAILGVVAIVARAIRRRRLDALPAFTLAGLLISTWMITPLSRPVWDHLPFLPLVQFPWRFLSAQSLFTALAVAQIAGGKTQDTQHAIRNTQYAAPVLGLLLAITALADLHPARLFIGPADVTTERLQLFEMFTANVGTTIRYEYLPRQVVPRLYTSDALIEPGRPMRAVALEGDAAASRLEAAPIRQVWRVSVMSSNATVAFPILWWPGWEATVDSKPAPTHPANSSGRIVLDLTPGEHTVVLSLGRTPLRAMAEGVSLVAALAVLVILAASFRRRRQRRAEVAEENHKSLGVFGVSALVFFIALAILMARSTPPATAGDETMDFLSLQYLHHNPDGVQLSPGLRLTNYLSSDEIQAGQTLNVTLSWINPGDPQTVTVKLVSPAQHLPGLDNAPTLAESSFSVVRDTPQTRLALAIPSDTPRGVYLLKAQTGADEVYLRPVRVRNETPAGDAPVLARFGDGGRIRLHRVRAEQAAPTQLTVTLDWSAAQPVEANYAIRVRLYGAAGEVVSSADTQPGYGFLPTSLWRPGELVADRYTLPLPEGAPPRSGYQIEVLLYDAATLAGVGQYIQDNVALTLYSRRPVDSPTLARFGPELALATLDVPATHQQGAPTLTINAGWLATSAQSADRIARWTAYDSAGRDPGPVFTQTLNLASGAPSSLWPAGAFVVGRTRLSIPASLAPGRYRLGVTVLNPSTQSEEGSYLAPSTFEVVGHPRSFAAPPMQSRSGVEFGREIRLMGYDLRRDRGQVALGMYWQAIVAPRKDYKVFVHLFDPADEGIATQYDAMPLEGRYPTSWWMAGEVVSETVTLNLADVRPGTYQIAVGLYDVNTATRLIALGPDGARLDADRAVLPESVTVPK